MRIYCLKRFLEWIFVKQKLHDNISKTPFVSEGEVLVLPLTTKNKKGSWYIEISKKGRRQVAVLSQIRTIDGKRLATKLGTISDLDIKKTKGAFVKLLLS